MKPHSISPWPLSAAIAAVLGAASLSMSSGIAGPVVATGNAGAIGPAAVNVLNNEPALYIIRFGEPPVAQYDGDNPQFAAIPRQGDANGRGKLLVKSPQARAYVDHLQGMQQARLASIRQLLGKPDLKPRFQMQYALNAAVVELSAAQARQVDQSKASLGVVAIERDRHYAPATDIGPTFIGATNLWPIPAGAADYLFINGFDGNNANGMQGPGIGDGIVIGVIDTGYNSESPSFSATDDSGYTITNPLGSGNFLGQCNVPGISLAGCNDKVIGVYDLVDAAAPFSVEDTQGHGSHTASTAGGNDRMATLNGYTTRISGVAPHANLVVYYVCSPDPAVQCQESSVAMAVELSILDGVVNALNYSISGGTDPWNDIASEAFLSATNAGMFFAAAAGNTSASVPNPVPGTVNHWEPWVITVAASTHTGGPIGPLLSATGPGTPPANTQQIALNEASGDTPATATIPATTPLILSPTFHISDTSGIDGCNPPVGVGYAANAFQNGIALISRGTCSFAEKTTNAVAAGAIAVVIADNRPEPPPSITVGVQPIPAYIVLQSDGGALQTFLAANAGAGTGIIPYPPSRQPSQPDVLAGFSLLGPAGIEVIKPDVEAPGVKILAAVANDGTSNGPNLVALYDGTSMATPHTTGSGALLLNLHPDWTPMEVKSALMMTAKQSGTTKPDGVTPADFYDRGSGRIQVDIASKVGLVMNETGSKFKAANPALVAPAIPGDPGTLNLSSMQNSNCLRSTAAGCSFVRTLRSTQSQSVTWTAKTSGDLASAITVTPATFSAIPQGFQSLQIAVDSSNLTADGNFNFGEVVLTPDDGSPTLHLPVSVAVPAPAISVPQSVAVAVPAGQASASSNLVIANAGGPTLSFNQDTTATDAGAFVLVDQPPNTNNGYFSTRFTDQGNTGMYAADDFTVTGFAPLDLSVLVAEGFGVGVPLSSYPATTPLHVRIYADVNGMPAGNPEAATPAAVWSVDTTFGGADVQVVGDTFVVFPATPTRLSAGRYWLVVYPDLPCAASQGQCSQGWAWFLATANTGLIGQTIFPAGPAPDNQWSAIPEATGFAMYIESDQACAALPWLAMSPDSGSVGGLSSQTANVTATAAAMTASSITGYLCIQSNDVNNPIVAVQVNATK